MFSSLSQCENVEEQIKWTPGSLPICLKLLRDVFLLNIILMQFLFVLQSLRTNIVRKGLHRQPPVVCVS